MVQNRFRDRLDIPFTVDRLEGTRLDGTAAATEVLTCSKPGATLNVTISPTAPVFCVAAPSRRAALSTCSALGKSSAAEYDLYIKGIPPSLKQERQAHLAQSNVQSQLYE